MSLLIEVPVEGGGRLLVEAEPEQRPGELCLAASRATPGKVVAKGASGVHFTVSLTWRRPEPTGPVRAGVAGHARRRRR